MITETHIYFMREVTKLARKHGVNHITINFDLSSSRNFLSGKYRLGGSFVKANWSEGRHGDNGEIRFESTDSVSVKEFDPPNPQASAAGVSPSDA